MADCAEKTAALAGWGRYRPAMCRVFRPVTQPELAGLLADGGTGRRIARGLGRSYGDTSVNADGAVVDMTRLNRMTAFDEEAGVLDVVVPYAMLANTAILATLAVLLVA